MTIAAQFPKTAALLVTLLMAMPVSGVAGAQSLPDVPRIPSLPLPGPHDHCVQSELTQPQLLADLNAALGGDLYFADDHGAPVLCGADNQPLAQYATLMAEGKGVIEQYNATAALLQRQADERDRATLPQGDIIYPTFPLLKDDFNGHRVGGVGAWSVVTEHGEDPLIRLADTTDANGTRAEYRFGDATGYARGAHQWLVSPMMDLDAVRGNADALRSLLAAEDAAIRTLATLCDQGSLGSSPTIPPDPNDLGNPSRGPGGQSPLSVVCGRNEIPVPFLEQSPYDKPGQVLVAAMTQQVKGITAKLPLVRDAATLTFGYRFNLANQTDGVRAWLYLGDDAPDRSTLFDATRFGTGASQAALDDAAIREANSAGAKQNACNNGGGNVDPILCHDAGTGGILLDPEATTGRNGGACALRDMAPVAAFRDDASADPDQACAFTGDHAGTLRFDLTNHTGQRAWLLLEVKTVAPSGRAGDAGFFQDASSFPRQTGFGFELQRVDAEGQAWYRNVRVENVGLNLPHTPAGNPAGDDPATVRIVAPGLAAPPVAVDLLNAGAEVENGTLRVSASLREDDGTLAGAVDLAGETHVVNLTPGEARRVWFSWTQPPVEGRRYALSAALTGDDATTNTGDITNLNTTTATQPNATAARLPNMASQPGGVDHTTASVDARAYVRHALTAVHAERDAGGAPLEVCSEIRNTICAPQPAAKKGETRMLQVGVRNDGSQDEVVTAQLQLSLGGVDKSSAIVDGATRDVGVLAPGETRIVSWTLIPSDPGAYAATAVFTTPAGTTVTATRQVYVQRTTGMLCFDNEGSDRECAPGFVLSQPDALAGLDVTAGYQSQDGLVVATAIRQDAGALYTRNAQGAWTATRDLSNQTLAGALHLATPANDTGFGSIRAFLQGPDALYLVGDNGTVLRDAPDGLTSIRFNDTLRPFALTTAAWWNGTLWAGGAGSQLVFWNQSAHEMQPDLNVTYYRTGSDGKPVLDRFLGTVHALVVQKGKLWLAADSGALLLNDTGYWHLASVGGSEAASDFTDALLVEGVLYVTGSGGLVARQPDAATRPLQLAAYGPLPQVHLGQTPDVLAIAQAPGGALYVQDSLGRVLFCNACDAPAAPRWAVASLALPPVGDAHAPARVVARAASPTALSLLTTGGAVLDFAQGSAAADNLGDWQALPDLYAQDGALEVQPSPKAALQAYRVLLPAAQTGFDRFHVTLHHNVMQASSTAEAYVRLVYSSAFPDGTLAQGMTGLNSGLYTCPPPSGVFSSLNQGQVPAVGAGVGGADRVPFGGDVCQYNGTLVQVGNLFLQDVANFTAPTSGGWDQVTLDVPVGTYNSAGRQVLGSFYGVEFLHAGPARWAIDDITVLGHDATGWHTLLDYGGSGHAQGLTRTVAYPIGDALASAGQLGGVVDSNANKPSTWDFHEVDSPYGYGLDSPWHLTTLGAQPVWAANDELQGGGSSPHLDSNVNARLVSPVLDLSSAFDPVVSFRHAYAFRTYTKDDMLAAGDTGWLEVQYLRQGPDECPPPATSDTTCGWTPFYNVTPDEGYPNGDDMGYPGFVKNDMTTYKPTWPDTLSGYITDQAGSAAHPNPGAEFLPLVGPDATNPASNASHSFWFRSARPGPDGKITSVLDPATYQAVRVDLKRAACRQAFVEADKGCIPLDMAGHTVDLSGHQVRFAFHLETNHVVDNGVDALYGWQNAENQGKWPTSYPGEGWYVTDFQVEGANPLGIDLTASSLVFREGYDTARLGVGPGTRVPVNVTIANHGLFDVMGYTGALEIRRVLDPVHKTSELIQTLPLAQQPQIAPGESVNQTFFWDVPAQEGGLYALTFTLTPLGIDRDENPLDNLVKLGALTAPIVAASHPEFHVETIVRPQNATSEIPRAIAIYLDNTGNVPLSGFEVTRDVRDQNGISVDHRTFQTVRPVAEGTRVNLAAVADLDPSTDVFFQPPAAQDYKLLVSATTGALVDGETTTVRSLDAFLFDDAESGVQGESFRGDWSLDPAWAAQSPGFRSDAAYGFGDPTTNKYPDNADASATLPVVDVGSARDAKVAFYSRYQFEPGFDAGALQASADGGRTWVDLPASPDPLNGLPTGFLADAPLSPSNPLHPDGNPDKTTYAFTGDSSTLPEAPGGWVFSQFDLTRFPNVTLSNVAYAFYRNLELKDYQLAKGNNTALPAGLANNATYTSSSWGSIANPDTLWQVQNLTQDAGPAVDAALGSDAATPPTGDGSLWWSGSASLADDGKVTPSNQMLNVPVDLTGYDAKDRNAVTLDWWEWAGRFGQVFIYRDNTTNDPPAATSSFVNAFGGFDGLQNPSPTYRYNVSKPTVIETRGHWYHMVSDVSALKGRAFNVTFVYAPIIGASGSGSADGTNCATQTPANFRAKCFGGSGVNLDDRGFAIDGFHVVASHTLNGQVADARTILSTADAWSRAQVVACPQTGAANELPWRSGSNAFYPCYSQVHADDGTHQPDMFPTFDAYAPLAKDSLGLTWSRASAVPGVPSGWTTIPVVDADGFGPGGPAGAKTPLGETPFAWYSGAPNASNSFAPATKITSCAFPDKPCPTPGSESRLVTPVFDLARIAGSDAALTFTHRYAFNQLYTGSTDYPLASGGVVEVQAFDDATGTWGPWQQIYARPDAMDPYPVDPVTGHALLNLTYDGEHGAFGPARGGYSAFTVNATPGTLGLRAQDSPFEAHAPTQGVKTDVQYLYSGCSRAIADNENGWVDARFDVSRFIGQKVRFGFHVAFNARSVGMTNDTASPTLATCTARDPTPLTAKEGGWWISNLNIVGDVLAGGPIQLRLRAATDGDVDAGHWQVDDVSVFGQRYQSNLALFADDAAVHRALPGSTISIPITVRNLGSLVRHGVAVEAHLPPGGMRGTVTLSGHGSAGNASEALDAARDLSDPANGGILLLASAVAPGDATTFVLNVTLDPTAPAGQTSIILTTLELDPTSGQFQRITSNEVQGLLQRVLTLNVTQTAQLSFLSRATTPVVGVPGASADLSVVVGNDAGVPVTATLQCSGFINDHTKPADTGSADYVPVNVTRQVIPDCGTRTVSIPNGGRVSVHFNATPTASGILHFHVAGHGNDGTVGGFDVAPLDVAMPVGQTPQPFADPFNASSDVASNWTTGTGEPIAWSYTRGHDATGAMIVGLDDNASNRGDTDQRPAGGHFQAVTPLVDLHNYTAGQPAFLTFWHQDRFGVGEGADVSAFVIDDETTGVSRTSVASCKLYPVTGYEGRLTEYVAPIVNNQKVGVDDLNAAWGSGGEYLAYNGNVEGGSGFHASADAAFFVSNGTWEEGWSKAVFDLAHQPACRDKNTKAPLDLVGHQVQFVFDGWTGSSATDANTLRGRGQGMVVDDVSVGPYQLAIHPVNAQRAMLLDNTTKTFNVIAQNFGSYADLVRVAYDAEHSSAPAGAILPASGIVALQPGESRVIPVTVTLPRDPSLLSTTYHATLLVQSVLDGAAGAATTLDVAFAPRSLPDLGVSVALPTGAAGSVQEGTDAFIPITVDNHGLADSPATRLRVVDRWVEGGTDTPYDLAVPAVRSYFNAPDQSSAVLELAWRPARGTVGTHELIVQADPDGLLDEYTRADDRAVLTVPVSPLLVPDLDITSATGLRVRNAQGSPVDPAQDADVSRYEVTAGELVGFELKVLNAGRAAATNVDVRASIGSLTLPAKTIAFIPAGGQAIVTFNWLAQKGEYNLSFDVRNEQLQLSTDNDHFPGTGLVLLTVKDYEVHVDLAPLPAAIDAGSSLKVPFNVTNAGNAGEELRFVAQAPQGVTVTLPRDGLFLRAGETYNGVARVDVSDVAVAGAPIPQFMKVLAISRENPMKVASAQAPLAVRAEYAGSLVATVASGSPPALLVPITARNEGNSLEPWTIRVDLPAGWAAQETLPSKLVVPPRGQATLLLHVSVPMGTAPGPQAVVTHATMPDGETREGAVSANVLPVRAATAKVVDADAKPAQGALAYPVAIQNEGNVATPFELLLTQLPAGVQATIEPSRFSLAPGAKTVATLLVTPNASIQAGDYPVTAYALFPGVTPDTAEGHANVQQLKVSIVRPDLQVSTLEYAPRQGLRAGDRVNVRVPIANGGTGAAADVPVHLFVDDVFAGETRVASLAAGGQTEATFNWTALPGAHTLTAVVDPYNDTVDPVRADNAVAAQVNVGGGDITGGLAAQRSKVPGPELGLALVALAALALALAKRGPRRPPK
ncbi:MAG: hypothetical protein QOE90_1127 [Thermoplasmata archaeon]|nr:hypothetical protein [Thermoplasmata archaeon]